MVSLQVMMVGTPEFFGSELRAFLMPVLVFLLFADFMLITLAILPSILRTASQKQSRFPLLAFVASLQVMMVGMPENPAFPALTSELFDVTWDELRAVALPALALLLVVDVIAIAAASNAPHARKAEVRQVQADALPEFSMPTKVDRSEFSMRSRCWSESTAATETPVDPSPRHGLGQLPEAVESM